MDVVITHKIRGIKIATCAAPRSYQQHHGVCASSGRLLYRTSTSRLLRPRVKLVLLVDTEDGENDLDARHEDERGLCNAER